MKQEGQNCIRNPVCLPLPKNRCVPGPQKSKKKYEISIINKRSFFLSFLSLMASRLLYYNLNLDQVFLWGSRKTNLVHYKSFLYWLLYYLPLPLLLQPSEIKIHFVNLLTCRASLVGRRGLEKFEVILRNCPFYKWMILERK